MVNHISNYKGWVFCWPLLLTLQAVPAEARSSEKSLLPPQTSQSLPEKISEVAGVKPLDESEPRSQMSDIAVAAQSHRSNSAALHESPLASATQLTSMIRQPSPEASPLSTSESPPLAMEPVAEAQERPEFAPKNRLQEQDSQQKPDSTQKDPKQVGPLLERFLDPPWTVEPQSATVSPADQQFLNPPDKSPTEVDEPVLPSDPELGVIQVAELRRDDELGVLQLRNPLQDPELGILELRQISPPSRRGPMLFLSSAVTASSSDNIFLVEDPIRGRFDDNFIRPVVTLTAFPAVGPNTNLLVAARASLLRYQEQTASSYDELRFQAGVRHRFSERVYGQLSLSRQLLFDEGFRDRFFSNTGIELTVGRRDRLTPQLTLDSYYQGQVFFSDPERFSNVLNSVGAYLGYRISPEWDTGIGYRLTISDFTRQSRQETYQRITGQLRYAITPAVRMSVFGGLSYGRSSESRITFDDTFFGISVSATVSIF